MARFLGCVQGSRGPAQRLGGSSGLTTMAASWSGAVRVHMYDNDGKDWVRIEMTSWHGAGEEHMLYDGPAGKLHRHGLTEAGKRAHHNSRRRT